MFPLHNRDTSGRCSCGKPDCSSPGKHPRTANGLKAATTDPDQIHSWWTQWPDANIGLPTGAVNGLVITDVDHAEGQASLERMIERQGPLPATNKVKTGNGYQLYFKHPGGTVKSKAPLSPEYPHVDSRGDGGYIVAPPSLHYTGARYSTMPSQVADAPAWLIELMNGGHSPRARSSTPAANDSIAEGSRNATLASLAGKLRRAGARQDEIEAALLTFNSVRCSPPLDDGEVCAVARSISSYEPSAPDDVLRTLNDAGNAERFARQWGEDVRYVPERKKWVIWSGAYWQFDDVAAVMEMAKRTAFDIYAERNQVTDDRVRELIARHSKTSPQAPRLNAMRELAQSIPTLVVRAELLDTDPWVLGVQNGTIDLREGTLMPARRDYITRVAPIEFDPTAKCPTFLEFLETITGGDKALAAYLQRLVGYMLTGDTSEQCLFYLYGTGANGKTKLLNLLKALVSIFLCRQMPVETIMARNKGGGPTPELACLTGTRAVMTTEVDEGSFLSESLVKQMTGGDPVPARHLFGDPFEYRPSFKLFVAGNHKANIRGGDDGIWRRIHAIPFNVTIPSDKRDPNLGEKLRAELPGILNWALRCCQDWQRQRLDPPAVVLEAVAEYREDMDILGQWLADHCEVGPDLSIYGGSAYVEYDQWARASGLRPWSRFTFGQKLKERFPSDRTKAGVRYKGFALCKANQPTIQRARVVSPTSGGPAPA